ncbi:OLC1v1028169C1 [Oldenlandia corymbosa var. corymbosa]|uniref:Peroxidase n=1 Tax=Oldenlandia corymbosa var. corymbosa TaxID=529605 RepID=A0AAV1CDV8_OLDCO|nr:OLC1v1028169C1 [Oldenlandia corymbosa var. corymbosa]
MALPYLLSLFLVSSLTLFNLADCQLTEDYYSKTCPDFQKIIQEIITVKQMSNPTTAAGTLRVFFHDCMVGGCDASLLISSNSFNKAERDADINESLPGDAFEVIVRAKTALELKCPGIVSCSDILAEATRDLITMVGGPFYKVGLGRKDSLTSKAVEVEGHIARSNMSITEIIDIFAKKGFNIREMVALTGAHTIGFSHCSEFSYRLFNFSKDSKTDPSMNPLYAAGLKTLCANYLMDKAIAAFNDAITPGKFDNMYYLNLQKGIGLLATDQAMASDPRTKPFVDLYAKNQTAFFEDFSRAMEKTGVYGVKTGNQGEVRRRCDSTNKS